MTFLSVYCCGWNNHKEILWRLGQPWPIGILAAKISAPKFIYPLHIVYYPDSNKMNVLKLQKKYPQFNQQDIFDLIAAFKQVFILYFGLKVLDV